MKTAKDWLIESRAWENRAKELEKNRLALRVISQGTSNLESAIASLNMASRNLKAIASTMALQELEESL